MKRDTQERIAVGLFAVICAVLYFNSLRNSFMFDDFSTLRDNAYIKDWRYIPLFFKGYFSSFPVPKGMFRPILMLTFSLNYFVSGLAPFGYHIINLFLHFFNGILLYSLLKLTFKKAPFGLNVIITSLFLAHPINVEAVSYIASRSDLLVTSFLLLGVLSYIQKRRLLTFLFYVLALLTKETAICFGLLVVLCDFVYGIGDSKNAVEIKSRIRENILFYIGLAALTLIYLSYRKAIFGGVGNIYPVRSLYSNVLTQSAVTLYYIRLFLFPVPLSIHHDLPILKSIFSPAAAGGVIFVAVILILIFALKKRQPAISFGLGWFLAGLAPKFYGTLNVIAAEHQFYPAGIGVYLVIVALVYKLYMEHKRYFIYVASGLIGVCAILTWFRNFEWKDGITLWKLEAKRSSSSAIAHNNLGYEYLKAGLYREAEKEFDKVFALSAVADTGMNARLNIASIRRIEGKYEEALVELQKVRQRNPNYAGVYNEIGIVYESMGKFNEAEKALKDGLKLYPNSPHLDTNLGFLCVARKQMPQAKIYFWDAIRCDPDFSLAYYGLGQVLEGEGRIDEAKAAYEKSVRLDPSYVKAHYALGTIYALKGDGTRALKELQESVRLDPSFAPAYNNLVVLYASMEPPRLELARQCARKAILLGYKVEDEVLRVILLK